MSEETRDIAKKQGGALATLDFVADSGMGLDNIDKGDLALPFLKLLQSMSDETKKKHAKYVEGAEAGMFYNTVTKKLYDGEKGIEVIPVFYKMTYPEWAPFERSEGRPISNDRGPSIMAETTQNKGSNKDVLKNGNEIIKTANHFVIINGDRPEKALMTMKSTQLKVSRGWNSLMEDQFEIDPKTNKSVPAPVFSRVYKLNSVENSGSFTWHGYNISMLRKVDNAGLYQMARDFHNSLKNSQQKTATVSEEDKSNY